MAMNPQGHNWYEYVLRARRMWIRRASWDWIEESFFDSLRWRWWHSLVVRVHPMWEGRYSSRVAGRRNSITDTGQRRHAAGATANIVIVAAAFEMHCARNHHLKTTANGDRQPIYTIRKFYNKKINDNIIL